MSSTPEKNLTFRDLYPTLTEEELKQAEADLRCYLAIVWEMQKEQLFSEPASAVDSSSEFPTMEERSNVSLTNK